MNWLPPIGTALICLAAVMVEVNLYTAATDVETGRQFGFLAGAPFLAQVVIAASLRNRPLASRIWLEATLLGAPLMCVFYFWSLRPYIEADLFGTSRPMSCGPPILLLPPILHWLGLLLAGLIVLLSGRRSEIIAGSRAS